MLHSKSDISFKARLHAQHTLSHRPAGCIQAEHIQGMAKHQALRQEHCEHDRTVSLSEVPSYIITYS